MQSSDKMYNGQKRLIVLLSLDVAQGLNYDWVRIKFLHNSLLIQFVNHYTQKD